ATGVYIENCVNVRLIGVSFSGLDVAIDVHYSRDVSVTQSNFGDSATGLRARNVTNLVAADNTHGHTRNGAHWATPLPTWGNMPLVWRRGELQPRVYRDLYGG